MPHVTTTLDTAQTTGHSVFFTHNDAHIKPCNMKSTSTVPFRDRKAFYGPRHETSLERESSDETLSLVAASLRGPGVK